MPGEKRPVKVVAASSFYDLASLKKHKAVVHSAAAAAGSRPSSQQHRRTVNPLKAPFKAFKTQKEAFEFLDKQPCADILRTFAFEVSASGQRVFIVSSAELFWKHYKALPPAERHHYEIIRQASPCHLYFDLEFCPASNPGLDGAALVVLLLAGVAQQLQELFGIPWHDSYALELDSSTAQKFSRHLLVRLPGIAFADACHSGRFARLVLLRLLARSSHSSQACGLLVRNKAGDGLSTFVDMGVYTRNRAFRLYLSSKYGKTACLRLTSRFGGATLDPQAAFSQLLISVLHHSSSSSGVAPLAAVAGSAEAALQKRQQWRWGIGAAAARTCWPVSLLQVEEPQWQQELQQLPLTWQQVPMLLLNPTPHNCSSQQLQWQQQQQQPGQCVNGGVAGSGLPTGRQLWGSGVPAAAAAAGAVVCYGPSPYPLLEQFILSVCVQGGVQGEVRSWLCLPGSVVFNMKNNRWCSNVERAHKSNGIYYVVDLREGTYYQKCYDPECRSYRSACMPLPSHVWQQYRQHTAEGAHAAALPAPKHTAAAAAVLGACEQPQQQQGEAQGEAAEEEDEQCLQLLQQFEEQQDVAGGGAAALEAAAGAAASAGAAAAQGSCFSLIVADVSGDDDEYALCLQLLQEVEGHAGWPALAAAADTG